MIEYSLKNWTDKDSWNNFLLSQKKTGNFLQSWEWGEFLSHKNKIFRLGITNKKNKLILIVQLNKENIKFTKKYYLYAAYGPIWKENLSLKEKQNSLKYLEKELKQFINDKNLAYLLFESNLEKTPENLKIFKNWKKEKNTLQPSDTLIIPIHFKEEELLAKMHHKTRYNIRLAKKKGVKIIWDKKGKYFEDWYKIMQLTAKRQKIRLLNKTHYLNLIKENTLTLILAEFENKIIAGNLLSLKKPTAVYVHGGSDYNYRKLMAPYLLQWESILKAKENDCQFYDLWGVNVNNKNPQWAGITRFKSAFNPEIKFRSYISSYVFIYKAVYYYFNQFLNKLRQFKKFVLSH